MITHQKLNIYQKYAGNNDMWLRMGSDEEHKLLTTEDWILIYLYLDNMSLAKQGQLAEQDLAEIENQVFENCENQEVAARFRNIITSEINPKPSLIKRFIHWLLSEPL
ncbi:hypothetical protein GCM10027422_04250 [Hymenobacter arcticus]